MSEAADNFGVQRALDRVRNRPNVLRRLAGYTTHYLVILFALSPFVIVALIPFFAQALNPYLLILLAIWVVGFIVQQLRLLDPLLDHRKPKTNSHEFRRKTVAVVGAGPAGLAALKECLAQGLDVVCYEKNNGIGGVYRYDESLEGGVWESLILTTSPWVTAFSDFQPSSPSSKHNSHDEYVAYLNGYVDHFALRDRIHLNHEVKNVVLNDEGQWSVTVDDETVESTRVFDHVVVCSGLNQRPKDFQLPGIENFNGDVFHASQYKKPQAICRKEGFLLLVWESLARISRPNWQEVIMIPI